MSSEQPLPKQSEAQDGVRWMGGKETRGVATCATAAAAGSTPAAAAAAASRGRWQRPTYLKTTAATSGQALHLGVPPTADLKTHSLLVLLAAFIHSFIHSAHSPAASCSRAAHFGLGSPGRPPPRAHVRCWRGVPSDRGPLKACAEAGKRGSALLHAWRFDQNHVPPSCGRKLSTVAATGLGGTWFWAQACAVPGGQRGGGGGGTLRRPRAAELPSFLPEAHGHSLSGLGGTEFRSTACCRRRTQGCCLRRRRHGVWVHGLLPLPPPQGCCLRRRRFRPRPYTWGSHPRPWRNWPISYTIS